MERTPRVSVGVPVYNGESFLDDCIASILGQTMPDLEVVISDAGSTDGTERICREFAARDPRVRYERAPSYLGVAQNHNRVFELARGEFFAWIGADDALEERCLERCLAAHEAEPDLVLVYPTAVGIDPAWRRQTPTPLLEDYRDDRLDLSSPSPSKRFHELVRHLRQCNAFMGLFRTARLRAAKPLADYQGFDRVLMAEMILAGRGRRLPEPLYLRRLHEEQVHRHLRVRAADRLFNRRLPILAYLESVNLFGRQLAVIFRASIPAGEKLRCAASLGVFWFVTRRHHLKKEVRDTFRRLRDHDRGPRPPAPPADRA